MIDASSEHLISLAEAAKGLPARRKGRRPHISCMYRWSTSGCRGIVLETIQIGGTRCTSREALWRFFARLTSPSQHGPAHPETPRQIARRRQQEIAAADAFLDREGL